MSPYAHSPFKQSQSWQQAPQQREHDLGVRGRVGVHPPRLTAVRSQARDFNILKILVPTMPVGSAVLGGAEQTHECHPNAGSAMWQRSCAGRGVGSVRAL